jgi:hypothetical protein
MPGEVILVDLKTGECIKADRYRLAERGIPEGFIMAEDVTIEQWCAALQNATKISDN